MDRHGQGGDDIVTPPSWTIGVLVAAALVARPATAQPRRVFVDVGMGPTAVFGPAGDNVGPGFNFGVGVTGKLAPNFDLKIDTLVTKHNVKEGVAAALGVGDGDGWLWHLSTNGVLTAPIGRVVSVYGVSGLGIYYRKVTLSTPSVAVVTACNPWLLICYPVAVPADQVAGERSTAGIGVNLGAGVNFHAGQTTLFVEVRYHYVRGPAMPTQDGGRARVDSEVMPITFGIRF